MNNQDWTRTENELPPERLVVETMNSQGQVQTLFRRGNLWWMPDGKMYVYYTPVFWRRIQ